MSGDTVLYLLIQYSYILKNDLLPISTVNKAFLQEVVPRISLQCIFKSTKKSLFTKVTPLKIYSPRIVKEISSLASITNVAQLTTIKFNSDFNEPILSSSLPKSIIQIIFGQNFNNRISDDALPPHLTTLIFGRQYNRPLPALPSELKQLLFWNTTKRRKGVLNKEFKRQYKWYNEKETEKDKMKELESYEYCIPHVEDINEKSHFNQPIVQKLPSSLTHIAFGHKFAHPIDNLPPSITHLLLGNKFSYEIPFQNFPNLEWLRLGDIYYSFFGLYPKLPSSVKTLVWQNFWRIEEINNFPYVTTLVISEVGFHTGLSFPNLQSAFISNASILHYGNYRHAYTNITHLYLQLNNNAKDTHVLSQQTNLPPNLTHLTVISKFNSKPHIRGDKIQWLCTNYFPFSVFMYLPSLTHFSCGAFVKEKDLNSLQFHPNSVLSHLAIPKSFENSWQKISGRFPAIVQVKLFDDSKNKK